ncbi:putative extracellular dioxygenase protein [Botrytis fragariae]|uniref:Putative extracellular dioxygenase protein n=1 Tax=Botrytis fragariae TaxID=1964551 RepID=A0A8H6APT0_9HELO|nr:putative extracellular dioxygenase protein [Botrytis fragariae]KAF5871586.1 putative extracellular dioxygenase protein [Botrytis fragariae]
MCISNLTVVNHQGDSDLVNGAKIETIKVRVVIDIFFALFSLNLHAMIYSSLLSKLVAAACVSHVSTAHPGQTVQELQGEIVERNIFFEETNTSRDLSHCCGVEDKNRECIAAAVARAHADLGLPQKKAPIKARATSPVRISHLSGLDVTPTMPNVEEIIYSNSSCILSLEGEKGPFYVSGEHIRSDLRETRAGVPLDIWNCKSTGVYGGIPASPINGNAGDASNINKTFLRGLQPTDVEEVAQFTSLFPGYYAGRTTHACCCTHWRYLSHIGQVFSDQSLITKVEALAPYNTDTQRLTANATHRVVAAELCFLACHSLLCFPFSYVIASGNRIMMIAGGSDPFFNYVLLGDTISDGIFAWITFGVNQGATYTASAAARLTANDGVPIAGGGRPPIA